MMAYRFVDRVKPEDKGTLCANKQHAEDMLDTFLETCRSRQYVVEPHHVIGDEYPTYLVHDQSGGLVGDFTITAE